MEETERRVLEMARRKKAKAKWELTDEIIGAVVRWDSESLEDAAAVILAELARREDQ